MNYFKFWTWMWIFIIGVVGQARAFGVDSNIEIDDNGETCKKFNTIIEENRDTERLFQSSLIGKWVSQRCETRTGPNFVIRSYTFHKNKTFDLIQIFYRDEYCSDSKYAISARGSFDFRSSSSFRLAHEINEISIVLHDQNEAKSLTTNVQTSCPGQKFKNFKLHYEYRIYRKSKKNISSREIDSSFNTDDESSQRQRMKPIRESEDDKCILELLEISLDELSSVRIYKRRNENNIKTELLLANMKTSKLGTQLFQLPLVLYDKSLECHFCDSVERSTIMNLPIFSAKMRLPLITNGEWISESCEASQDLDVVQKHENSDSNFELFSMKILRLTGYKGDWEQEIRYYSNYKCSNLIAIHRASGHYHADTASKIVIGATKMDFETQNSHLKVFDENFVNLIKIDPSCGGHNWKLRVWEEIPTTGCSSFIPSVPVKRNIAKLDIDENRSYFLYLGEDGSSRDRPTGYAYPLVQCLSKAKLIFIPSRSSRNSTISLSSTISLILVAVILNYTRYISSTLAIY